MNSSSSSTVVQLGVILKTGRKIIHDVRGLGLSLQKGNRYLFFMKHNQQSDCFTIVKYWGLRSGSLVPQSEDDQVRRSMGNSSLAGAEENLVIPELRRTLGK